MKRIYSIRNGNVIFFKVLILGIISATIGVFLIPHIEAIGLFGCSILFFSSLLILKYFNYLNYIEVCEDGIKIKKQLYSWDKVFITVDFSVPNQHMRNAYVYQFYFGTDFLLDKSQRKKHKEEGFFIDITVKRMNLIQQYYKKKFLIVNESPLQSDILLMLKEHNRKYNNELSN